MQLELKAASRENKSECGISFKSERERPIKSNELVCYGQRVRGGGGGASVSVCALEANRIECGREMNSFH